MEKKKCIVIVILVAVDSVIAEDLACCRPSTYILPNKKNLSCYDPKKDTTVPMRLVCNSYGGLYNFSVKSGMIEFQITDLYKEAFGPDLACYGNLTNYNMTTFKSLALLCTDEEEVYYDKYRIMNYSGIVSVVFLCLTTIIYAVFGELRDLFGKSVINFCGSLAIGLGILAFQPASESMASCALQGFSIYFFLVASFFWSNSISVQVLRDARRSSTVDYGWKEFRWYMLYSWGLPTILTTIMLIVNYHPGNHQKPGIGLNHCWFLTRTQEWYYLNSVVTILLVINFAIFMYIATTFWRFAFKSTHMKTLKYKLSMTIRLIILMGLPWIFKMISLAVGGQSLTWFILEVICALQGVLIFLVLVVRKRVVKVLQQRGLLACCSGPVERWLAAGDGKINVIQHTDVFLREDTHTHD